jgi:hypothetical protein
VRLRIGVVAAGAAALIAAGCGGSVGGDKAGSGGPATVAPGNTAAYVWSNNDFESPGWKNAEALLDRFPGKQELIDSFTSSLRKQGLDWETDVKPALGNESAFVWLDFQHNGDDFVVIAKPKDRAKFLALLAKSNTPPVHEDVDGWIVVAQKQAILDLYDQAREGSGSLDDQSAFGDAYDALPADSIAKVWVGGNAVETAIDRSLKSAGSSADTIKKQLGTVDAITASLTPGSDGVKLAARFSGDLKVGGGTYHAELPSALPAGATFYWSLHGLGDLLNKFVDAYPNIDQQRAQVELVLGYPLKDVFDLVSGESAIAVYPVKSGTPQAIFAAKVSDESKARTILDRLATLAAASGNLQIKSVQVGSIQAKEITLSGGTSAFAAVFDGTLVTTNSRALLEQTAGSGSKLAGDSAFKSAVAGAGMPGDTTGFLYADLSSVLKFGFDYAESHGRSISPAVKDNTAPLGGLLLFGSKDGGNLDLAGFLGIQ